MKFSKIITFSISALMLAGIGATARSNKASASQPARAIRYLNNRDTHCYYGYLIGDSMHEHYKAGTLPKKLRHNGKQVTIINPDDTKPIKRHGQYYYLDTDDYMNNKFNGVYINKRDFGPYKHKNKILLRKSRRTLKRNKKLIKRLQREDDNASRIVYIYDGNKEFHFHQ